MTRETDYQLITGVDIPALQAAVQAEIAKAKNANPEHWEIIGEVHFNTGSAEYRQGMVKLRQASSITDVIYTTSAGATTIDAQRANGYGVHDIVSFTNNLADANFVVATLCKYRSTPKGC